MKIGHEKHCISLNDIEKARLLRELFPGEISAHIKCVKAVELLLSESVSQKTATFINSSLTAPGVDLLWNLFLESFTSYCGFSLELKDF